MLYILAPSGLVGFLGGLGCASASTSAALQRVPWRRCLGTGGLDVSVVTRFPWEFHGTYGDFMGYFYGKFMGQLMGFNGDLW